MFLWLATFNTQVTAGEIARIRFIQGIGAPCFFIPIIMILLSGLPDDRIASASGLSNFLRILGGSFGTSISVTLWTRRESYHQGRLTETITTNNPTLAQALKHLQDLGFSTQKTLGEISQTIVNQAYMLATNDVFWVSGFIFTLLLIFIWFAKPPFEPAAAPGEGG